MLFGFLFEPGSPASAQIAMCHVMCGVGSLCCAKGHGHHHLCSAWRFAPCLKKLVTLLDLCVSSLRRGHANLLCIVPILTDDPRRESMYSPSCRGHKPPIHMTTRAKQPMFLSNNEGRRMRHAVQAYYSSLRKKACDSATAQFVP